MSEFIIEETKKIEDGILQYTNEIMLQESRNIDKEKAFNRNISFAFVGIGGMGEIIALLMYPNSFGSASKGGCAFDNYEYDNEKKCIIRAREIKTCCSIQPKNCLNCNKKLPHYQEKCLFCNQSNFGFIKDSRFGIDAKAHLEYEHMLESYIMIHIDEDEQNNIRFRIYKINSNNEYFKKYIKNQNDNSTKSNTCNLLPNSYDFYASGPIRLAEFTYNLSGNLLNVNFNLLNETPIDFNVNCLKMKEKHELSVIIEDKLLIPYEQIKDRLVIRKKNLNRNRGETSRN